MVAQGQRRPARQTALTEVGDEEDEEDEEDVGAPGSPPAGPIITLHPTVNPAICR
jgi:hypothetical protein